MCLIIFLKLCVHLGYLILIISDQDDSSLKRFSPLGLTLEGLCRSRISCPGYWTIRMTITLNALPLQVSRLGTVYIWVSRPDYWAEYDWSKISDLGKRSKKPYTSTKVETLHICFYGVFIVISGISQTKRQGNYSLSNDIRQTREHAYLGLINLVYDVKACHLIYERTIYQEEWGMEKTLNKKVNHCDSNQPAPVELLIFASTFVVNHGFIKLTLTSRLSQQQLNKYKHPIANSLVGGPQFQSHQMCLRIVARNIWCQIKPG